MKNKKVLEVVVVIIALIGYIAVSVYAFYEAFQSAGEEKFAFNTAIAYLASGLTGLVGGIVAVAFGVEHDTPPNDGAKNFRDKKPESRMSIKTKSLGSFSSTTKSDDNGKSGKEKIGMFYAIAYILIGVAAIVIWVMLDAETSQSVKNMATTFVGLLIPIVVAYFK